MRKGMNIECLQNQGYPTIFYGGATAANQYEGGYDEAGKGLNAIDVLTNGSFSEPRKVTWKKEDGTTGFSPLVWGRNFSIPEDAEPTILEGHHYPSHTGTDFYHRHQEDIKLMAEMGFKVFRFSMNWTRILDSEGSGTLERIRKDSFFWYKKVISSNGEDLS